MNEDIQFLKELQQELLTQEYDSQAAPRYWTVGDFKMVGCPEGNQDTYWIGLPNRDHYGELDDLIKDIEEEVEDEEDYSEEAREEFKELDTDDSDGVVDWIKEHYDEDAYLIPVREEHIIHPNTMFLTKAEAKRHIELNHYHYSPKAHTYAMTAWRAPKVERLLKILESFDWESIESKKK